jgi:hypothetical protein
MNLQDLGVSISMGSPHHLAKTNQNTCGMEAQRDVELKKH